VGIIDFLQDWTCAKKVAMCVKCCECNKATIPPVCSSVLFFIWVARRRRGGERHVVASVVSHRTPSTRRPDAYVYAQVPCGDRFASFVDAKFSGDGAPGPEVVALDATP